MIRRNGDGAVRCVVVWSVLVLRSACTAHDISHVEARSTLHSMEHTRESIGFRAFSRQHDLESILETGLA